MPPDVTNDPNCQREISPDGVQPTVQCEWESPPMGDPTEGSVLVYSSPTVADLNLDGDPNKLQPSVVLTTFEGVNGRTGTLRIFDGRTCEEQLHIGGDDDPNRDNRPGYGTSWAIADLDGDVASGGHPEIIGLHRVEQNPPANTDPLTLIAFELSINGGAPAIARRWYGRDCTTGTPVEFGENTFNFGAGVWDLNDDGSPEIVLDELVFDKDGCLLTPSPASVTDYLRLGLLVTVADVDFDQKPELIRHDRVAEWTGSSWSNESWFVPDAAQKPGHVAVVDLGQYSTLPGVGTPNQLPEVVVVSAETTTFEPNSTGTIRVQALDGSVVWGPLPLLSDPGVEGGHGGPPTAADFDGDGQPELAAAANQYYAVYDPDCDATPTTPLPERPGGRCDRDPAMASMPEGVLWAQPSQDFSSSATGSSVFDFDGDGAAEAVYRDECYLRVYEGATGKVIFSAPAASGTGYELPVIADVDGDFATEILVARAGGAISCPATDPLISSGATPFESKAGFVILRDPMDRWASSRPIWNQHAYSVTHVTDTAEIPQSSAVLPNWTQPGLNNFRQNSQGDLGVLNIADLTVVFTDPGDLCAGQSGQTTLEARVCNRGTNPVQDGALVRFVESPDDDAGIADGGVPGGTLTCEVSTTKLLGPGECEVVSCTGNVSGGNVFVIVDPDGTISDCHPGNNDGAGAFALCPEVQ